MENPNEIKRSWALQSQWQTGPRVINKLVPTAFSKIAVNFVQTWREEALPQLDWGAKNFSVIIPEGIRCFSAAYLEVDLPQAKYRKYPGLYIIKNFRIRSAGNIVYEADYNQYLADHCESMQQQKLTQFSRIYLGGNADSASAGACCCQIVHTCGVQTTLLPGMVFLALLLEATVLSLKSIWKTTSKAD
jgi:hypothetical protein